jgi:hypothetical protein
LKKALVIIAAVVSFFGLLLYFTLGSKRYRVEVCVEFNGRTDCRVASATTKEHARRTATENACALVSSGVTDTIACGNKQPVSVKWLSE